VLLGECNKQRQHAGTVESIKKLVEDLNNSPVPENVEVVIAPAFIHLYQVLQSIKPPIKIAAQNCWSTHMGAYTGEVSTEFQPGAFLTFHERHEGDREDWQGKGGGGTLHDVTLTRSKYLPWGPGGGGGAMFDTYTSPIASHNTC